MRNKLTLLLLFVLSVSLFSENKIALLIANGKYNNFSSLVGPTNEAEALSTTLKGLGFDVILLKNATREQMLDGLDNIKSRVNGKGGIAFFHYGGHGVQAQGKNYLIPVDADIPDEKKLATRAVDIDEVMSSLDSSGSDTNIVILDACRNNPLPAGSGRSAARGLTVMGAKPKNSIIVFSAEAGTVAQDGLFTPTLTKLITQKDKSLTQILMELRKEVSQKTNGSQIPGEYNQLFDDVFFNQTDSTQAQIVTNYSKEQDNDLYNSEFAINKINSSYYDNIKMWNNINGYLINQDKKFQNLKESVVKNVKIGMDTDYIYVNWSFYDNPPSLESQYSLTIDFILRKEQSAEEMVNLKITNLQGKLSVNIPYGRIIDGKTIFSNIWNGNTNDYKIGKDFIIARFSKSVFFSKVAKPGNYEVGIGIYRDFDPTGFYIRPGYIVVY